MGRGADNFVRPDPVWHVLSGLEHLFQDSALLVTPHAAHTWPQNKTWAARAPCAGIGVTRSQPAFLSMAALQRARTTPRMLQTLCKDWRVTHDDALGLLAWVQNVRSEKANLLCLASACLVHACCNFSSSNALSYRTSSTSQRNRNSRRMRSLGSSFITCEVTKIFLQCTTFRTSSPQTAQPPRWPYLHLHLHP